VLVRALSKQTGIARADVAGELEQTALAQVSAETAEEFNLIPLALKDDGRTLVVAMSDPANVMVTDHLRSLTGCRIEAQLAGASAIRAAIARWYRGEELAGDDSSMKIVNNSGDSVVTVDAKKPQPKSAGAQDGKEARASALEVLRGVEETQRRSVAALKAMVELLIEKGVFSREEYLARVKR
jgi:hypothetical protein